MPEDVYIYFVTLTDQLLNHHVPVQLILTVLEDIGVRKHLLSKEAGCGHRRHRFISQL